MSGWGGNSVVGGGAGTGVYIGEKDWYAEMGGFSYQTYIIDSGKTPSASLGAGANFTVYLIDAKRFFTGKMKYTRYTLGPFSMTFSEDPCSEDLTGATFSFGGQGFGWTIHQKGYTMGIQGALQ